MAIAKSRDQFEHTHEFAAVESSCEQLAEVLSKSRGFKKEHHVLEAGSLTAKKNETRLILVYSMPGSNWTIVDPLNSRDINLRAIDLATKKLGTQLISAGYCCNTASFSYSHVRNGRTIEEYCSTDPDFHQLTVEEAKKKGWQLCSDGSRRLKTKRKIKPNLDSADGFDLLSELSDELGVDVPPPLNWEVEGDTITVDPQLDDENACPFHLPRYYTWHDCQNIHDQIQNR